MNKYVYSLPLPGLVHELVNFVHVFKWVAKLFRYQACVFFYFISYSFSTSLIKLKISRYHAPSCWYVWMIFRCYCSQSKCDHCINRRVGAIKRSGIVLRIVTNKLQVLGREKSVFETTSTGELRKRRNIDPSGGLVVELLMQQVMKQAV